MEERFLELMKETLEIDGRNISLSDKFRDYPEWDSLGLLSVIAMIDEEFNIVIESSVFQKLETLSELYDHISKHAKAE